MAAQHSDNRNGREVKGIYNNENEVFCEATINTIRKIKRKYGTRSRTALLCTIHDKTSPGYEWLLLGWVAEERHMASGRIYRYYYDPGANFYRSKAEVLATWEYNKIILIN